MATVEETYELEADLSDNDDVTDFLAEICVCGLPSTASLVECANESCNTKWFHETCVTIGVGDSDSAVSLGTWFCKECDLRRPKEGQAGTCLQRKEADLAMSADEGQAPGPATSVTQTASTSRELHGSSKDHKTTKEKVQSAKMIYPTPVFMLDDALSDVLPDVKHAIRNILPGGLINLKTPFTDDLRSMSASIQEKEEIGSLDNFSLTLGQKVWNCIQPLQGKHWTEDRKSKMWSSFHKMRCSSDLSGLWKGVLDSMSIYRNEDVERFFLQHVTEEVHSHMLQRLMERDMPTSIPEINAERMDPQEEQALRYASGYIPHKLIKKFQKMGGNDIAESCISILSKWADQPEAESDSFLEFSKNWLDAQNRGGLFRVNDTVYKFFRSMEYATRKSIQVSNVKYLKNKNILGEVISSIKSNKYVLAMWDKVVEGRSDSISSLLLEEVVKCFAKMRCYAFVKVYLIIRREAQTDISQKGKKGLRKELAN